MSQGYASLTQDVGQVQQLYVVFTARLRCIPSPLVLVAGVLLLLCSGCQEELPVPGTPTTGREVVEASVRYHDPVGRWAAFAAHIDQYSMLAGASSGWNNELYFDRARDTFSRRQQKDGYELLQVVSASRGCRASWPSPEATRRDTLRLGLGRDKCEVLIRQRDFFGFLIGLPMSALEGDQEFGQLPERVDFLGESAFEVPLTYPGRENAPAWWLYISTTNYQLLGAKFIQANGFGEILSYPEQETYDGFLLKPVQTWLKLDGTTAISTDRLTFKLPTEAG